MNTPKIAYIIVYKNSSNSEYINNSFVSIDSYVGEEIEHLLSEGAIIINIINIKNI